MDKRPEYYEGTLQLRNPSKEVLDFVRSQINKSKDVFIAKQTRLKTGYDLQISSKKFLMSLAKKLQGSFGGEITLSRKLFSRDRQTGKSIWRVTVLHRLPKFKKGDIINYKGKKVKVLYCGKKVGLMDVDTGRRYTLSFRDLS